ncbi:hypothetical protein HOY80DRAFT_658100 [Tuber brumale]|nr:hypothetical protein HOY80DRAFT_658100 [Tuber brumale]
MVVEDDAATRMHKQLGYYLYIFPALLLATGIVRSLYYSVRNARMNYAIDSESQNPVAWRTYPPSALSNWFKRTIQYPALFRGRHRKPIGWYTFPTRIETILVATYWLLNIIFLVVNRNQKGLGGKSIDSVKLIGDRAGTLALWNLPVFFLLAGRNDFLVWLTGWSYSMFHVFHKWIARCAVLMAVVHSLAYAIYMYQSWYPQP